MALQVTRPEEEKTKSIAENESDHVAKQEVIYLPMGGYRPKQSSKETKKLGKPTVEKCNGLSLKTVSKFSV